MCGNLSATSNIEPEVNLLFDWKSYDNTAKKMKAVKTKTNEFKK